MEQAAAPPVRPSDEGSGDLDGAEVSCPDGIEEEAGATVTCTFTIPGWMTGPLVPGRPRKDLVGRAEFRIEEFEDTWWSDSSSDPPRSSPRA
jgi:hypothetical protein